MVMVEPIILETSNARKYDSKFDEIESTNVKKDVQENAEKGVFIISLYARRRKLSTSQESVREENFWKSPDNRYPVPDCWTPTHT